MVGLFPKKSFHLKVVDYFCKKAPPLEKNTALRNTVKKVAI